MIKDRSWTVLFICGASGSGKSSLAYALGRFYGVNVVEADDIHCAVKMVTDKEKFPAIHTDEDWKKIGVDGNVQWLIDVSRELSPVLKALADRHIEDELPVIIEGDFIDPGFTAALERPGVRTIFVREADRDQFIQNFLAREGGALQNYRADICAAYDRHLFDVCEKSGIAVVEARPWDTVLERAVEALM